MATGTKRKAKGSKKVGKAKGRPSRGALSSGLRAARDLVAGAVAIGLGMVPSKGKSAAKAKAPKAKATKKKATKKKATTRKAKSTRKKATRAKKTRAKR